MVLKKVFLALFVCSVGWADTGVTPVRVVGSITTTSAPSIQAINVVSTGTFKVDFSTGVRVNTTGGSNLGVDFSTGVVVLQPNAFNIVSTQTFKVDYSTGVQVNTGSRFLGVDHSTGVLVTQANALNVFSTQTYKVDYSTGVRVNTTGGSNLGVDFSTGVVVKPGTQFLGVDFSTGIVVKPGTQFLGVDHSTGVKVNTLGGQNLGIDLSSGALTTVLVSSNVNMPAQINDAAIAKTMGDNEGRPVVVSGVPSSVILTTSPTSALAGFMVLVASPAATSFVHMCYCNFTNTSAAVTTGTLYPSGGVVNTNIVFGIAASGITQLGVGCGAPFLNTTVGGSQVTWRPVGAVTTLFGYCQYYLSNSP